MGSLCSNQTDSTTIESKGSKEMKEKTEKDIPIPKYESRIDKTVDQIENKYMFLRKIKFEDYLYSLCKFSMDTATIADNYSDKIANFSCHDDWFNEDLSEDYYQVFVDNKIVKHSAIFDTLQNETYCSVFKDIMIKFYKKLNDKIKRENENFTFKKCHALILGLLFCKGSNISKIKFLFDLFSVDGKFTNTSEFTEFQYSLYLAASYVILAIRVDLSGNYSDFQSMNTQEIKKLLDACENKDCKHLVEVINNKYFNEDGAKEYFIEDFKGLFSNSSKDQCFGFILTSAGIRYLLEQNNV